MWQTWLAWCSTDQSGCGCCHWSGWALKRGRKQKRIETVINFSLGGDEDYRAAGHGGRWRREGGEIEKKRRGIRDREEGRRRPLCVFLHTDCAERGAGWKSKSFLCIFLHVCVCVLTPVFICKYASHAHYGRCAYTCMCGFVYQQRHRIQPRKWKQSWITKQLKSQGMQQSYSAVFFSWGGL